MLGTLTHVCQIINYIKHFDSNKYNFLNINFFHIFLLFKIFLKISAFKKII